MLNTSEYLGPRPHKKSCQLAVQQACQNRVEILELWNNIYIYIYKHEYSTFKTTINHQPSKICLYNTDGHTRSVFDDQLLLFLFHNLGDAIGDDHGDSTKR